MTDSDLLSDLICTVMPYVSVSLGIQMGCMKAERDWAKKEAREARAEASPVHRVATPVPARRVLTREYFVPYPRSPVSALAILRASQTGQTLVTHEDRVEAARYWTKELFGREPTYWDIVSGAAGILSYYEGEAQWQKYQAEHAKLAA